MPRASGYQFDFSGGALCLDFVNTLGDRPRATEEHLCDYGDLVRWAEQAALVTRREAVQLRAAATERNQGIDRAFARVREFREQLYGVFSAVAAGRSPGRQHLGALNTALAEAMAHARVESHDDGFAWSWAAGGAPLDRLMWPVVRSAADLLVSSSRPDIRECASGTCSWLFVDRSPTRRRRWCSMKTCGNRDKARRFYKRQHTGQ